MAVNERGREISLWLAERVYFLLSRLLFASCRISMVGEGAAFIEKCREEKKPFIAASWHYGVILLPYLSRGRRWVAMVSASKDGEYIARILEGMGCVTVRGSRNRQGISALKNMLEAMADDRNAIIIADGSQGPPRRAQAGAVLLAARSSCPIVPVSWSCSSYWTFRSWDRTVLPKPFSRIEVFLGPPFPVPQEARGRELEDYREQLEQRLEETYGAAWRLMGKKEH